MVIDCDPGIDDAMTLALACRSPELELLAVTTVEGNVPLSMTTVNALAVLGACGRDEVPVAAGADRGLVRAKPNHAAVHGPNGLGGVELDAPRRAPAPRHAVDELARLLRESPPGEVTIVAIGPLTNLALLLERDPQAARRAGRIVAMGGSVGPGNVTPAAEYNTWADPEAAARVCESGVELWLAQLEATRRATLESSDRAAITAGSEVGRQLIAMMDGYDEGVGVNPALHDVVALAPVIDPSLVRTQPARVEVVTDSGPRRGETVIELGGDGDLDGHRVNVIVDVDVTRLRRLLVERLAQPDPMSQA